MPFFLRVGTSADFEAKLNVCDDKDFHQLHELIMKKATAKYSPLSSSFGSHGDDSQGEVSVSLKFMVGEAAQLRRDQSVFKNVIEVRRLGFPNVIMPGDVRYVSSNSIKPTLRFLDGPKTLVFPGMICI